MMRKDIKMFTIKYIKSLEIGDICPDCGLIIEYMTLPDYRNHYVIEHTIDEIKRLYSQCYVESYHVPPFLYCELPNNYFKNFLGLEITSEDEERQRKFNMGIFED